MPYIIAISYYMEMINMDNALRFLTDTALGCMREELTCDADYRQCQAEGSPSGPSCGSATRGRWGMPCWPRRTLKMPLPALRRSGPFSWDFSWASPWAGWICCRRNEKPSP